MNRVMFHSIELTNTKNIVNIERFLDDSRKKYEFLLELETYPGSFEKCFDFTQFNEIFGVGQRNPEKTENNEETLANFLQSAVNSLGDPKDPSE